jgi:alpha-D-ribose 1-methylphosphonate 5-phosphate C-P lyase
MRVVQIISRYGDLEKIRTYDIKVEMFEHMRSAKKIREMDTKEELTNAFDIIGQDKHVRVSVFFPYTHNLEIDVPDCTFPSYQM